MLHTILLNDDKLKLVYLSHIRL